MARRFGCSAEVRVLKNDKGAAGGSPVTAEPPRHMNEYIPRKYAPFSVVMPKIQVMSIPN